MKGMLRDIVKTGVMTVGYKVATLEAKVQTKTNEKFVKAEKEFNTAAQVRDERLEQLSA